MFKNSKFTQYFGQREGHVHMKMSQTFIKTEFTKETNDKYIYILDIISLCSSIKWKSLLHISVDQKYNLPSVIPS